MLRTCENTYSSSWFDVIKKNFEDSEHNINQTAICTYKAWKFKWAVENFGKYHYSGEESYCKDSCIIQYLLGMHEYDLNQIVRVSITIVSRKNHKTLET